MNNVNIKNCIKILSIISGILIFIFLKYINFKTLNIIELTNELINLVSKVTAINMLLIIVFSKWGWRLRLFKNWLVSIPDLNGIWEGHIKSTWVNPETGKTPDPIPTILNIKQTLLRISCVMITNEMKSYSFAEAFRIEEDQQIIQLIYSYISIPKPSVKDRSQNHEGTMLFNIINNPANYLEGYYWTSRKTTGEIIMKFKQKKVCYKIPDEFKYSLSST